MQDLSLGSGCRTKGIALHEIMHTLGFYHEQARLDRDKHIVVNYHNAINGKSIVDRGDYKWRPTYTLFYLWDDK